MERALIGRTERHCSWSVRGGQSSVGTQSSASTDQFEVDSCDHRRSLLCRNARWSMRDSLLQRTC